MKRIIKNGYIDCIPCDKQKSLNKTRIKALSIIEILAAILIVGIIAMLIIPSMVKNYKENLYDSARAKALMTFGEAGKMAAMNMEYTRQENALDFVRNNLSQYLQITKVCDTAEDCDFPSYIKPSKVELKNIKVENLRKWKQIGVNTSQISSPTDDASMSIFVKTADKFSALMHYNPKCARNSKEITWDDCQYEECWSYAVDQACMNVIYDMNGKKDPNRVGEDVGFVTIFWAGLNATSVAPGILPYGTAKAIYDNGSKKWSEAQKLCAESGTKKTPYSLASVDELQSIAINSKISALLNDYFWTGSTVVDRKNYSWHVSGDGKRKHNYQTGKNRVWCVKR